MLTAKEKITPKQAALWLESVPEFQRARTQSTVDRIAKSIELGQWRENGSTIVFNRDGKLIDGQHRLAAIAQAGKTVWSLVVRGVASGEETFCTIDSGKARRLPDFVRCRNANIVSAMMRFHYGVVFDLFPWMNGFASVPVTDILKVCGPDIPSMEEVAIFANVAARVSGASGFFSFVMWHSLVNSKIPRDTILSFCDGVATGAELSAGDPRLLYRNRALARNDSSGKNFVMDTMAQRALLLKAFYAFVDGKEMSKLIWNSTKEPFPELR